jgi:Ubiquitin interaction motif
MTNFDEDMTDIDFNTDDDLSRAIQFSMEEERNKITQPKTTTSEPKIENDDLSQAIKLSIEEDQRRNTVTKPPPKTTTSSSSSAPKSNSSLAPKSENIGVYERTTKIDGPYRTLIKNGCIVRVPRGRQNGQRQTGIHGMNE